MKKIKLLVYRIFLTIMIIVAFISAALFFIDNLRNIIIITFVFLLISLLISLFFVSKITIRLYSIKGHKYWNKVYIRRFVPNGKNFLRFYFGKETFDDAKIGTYKIIFFGFLLLAILWFLGIVIFTMMLWLIDQGINLDFIDWLIIPFIVFWIIWYIRDKLNQKKVKNEKKH